MSKKDIFAVKWVYKARYVVDGSIQNNKQRLVTNTKAQRKIGSKGVFSKFKYRK
jgi:hypothetical protein